jgi:hypothetical protein
MSLCKDETKYRPSGSVGKTSSDDGRHFTGFIDVPRLQFFAVKERSFSAAMRAADFNG